MGCSGLYLKVVESIRGPGLSRAEQGFGKPITMTAGTLGRSEDEVGDFRLRILPPQTGFVCSFLILVLVLVLVLEYSNFFLLGSLLHPVSLRVSLYPDRANHVHGEQ